MRTFTCLKKLKRENVEIQLRFGLSRSKRVEIVAELMKGLSGRPKPWQDFPRAQPQPLRSRFVPPRNHRFTGVEKEIFGEVDSKIREYARA
jgi:hypothetical protein